jgi:predicted phage tail protein
MESHFTTIRLYGKFGAKYGRVHHVALDSNSPGEAMAALCSQIRGLAQDLMTSADRGIRYAVFVGKRNIAEEQLSDRVGRDEIRIAPVLQGSKRGGILQTIVGAVLVVVGVYFSQAWAIQLGASMMLGGVLQMLSPQQKGLGTKDSPNNGASYHFNGPVNTSAQGNPVPLLYGRLKCGSAVVSAGIYAEDKA